MSEEFEPFCNEAYAQGKSEGLLDGLTAALLLARSITGTREDVVESLERIYMEEALR